MIVLPRPRPLATQVHPGTCSLSPRPRLAGVLTAIALIVTASAVAPASAAVKPSVSGGWTARFDGGASDSLAALALSPDGKFLYVTGAIGTGPVQDYGTLAYDATTGAPRWTNPARFDGTGNGIDQATALAVSPNGDTVFVTGNSYGGGTTKVDYATLAYDATTGAPRWANAARYNGPGNGGDYATALAVSPDGMTVYVTGRSPANGQNDYLTIAYDAATGALRWPNPARENGPGGGGDGAQALAVAPNGGTVYVTGDMRWGAQDGGQNYGTVAYHATNGLKKWGPVRYNHDPANLPDQARALAVSPDGKFVYVTGRSADAVTNYDYATVAYDDAALGAQRWEARYSGPANGVYVDEANALGVSRDGSTVYVTGKSTGVGTKLDYATLAYNSLTGVPRWAKAARYNGPGNSDDDALALAVRVVPNYPHQEYVAVTGKSDGKGTGTDFATVVYGPNGGQAEFRYTGPPNSVGSDGATGVALSLDSSFLFVAGTSEGSNGTDYAIVAYPRVRTIWDQNDNDSGFAISSQNFESGYDAYDDAAADDFKITLARDIVTEVDVTGQYFNGSGPARDETVTIYQDAGGLPGAVIATATAMGTDVGGSFSIEGLNILLARGTYWLSVVANMDFEVAGQWGWEGRTVKKLNPAVWENPGGGWGMCPSWDTIQNCFGYDNDLMFTILSKR
jgi:hypothetical protein